MTDANTAALRAKARAEADAETICDTWEEKAVKLIVDDLLSGRALDGQTVGDLLDDEESADMITALIVGGEGLELLRQRLYNRAVRELPEIVRRDFSAEVSEMCHQLHEERG